MRQVFFKAGVYSRSKAALGITVIGALKIGEF